MRSLELKIFFSAVVATTAYLISPWGGVVVMALVVAGILLKTGRSTLEKILLLLIISWPLYTNPVIPGLPVIASWTTVSLLFFCLYAIRIRSVIQPWDLYLLFAWMLATGVALFNSKGGVTETYYVVQFFVFFFPAVLAFLHRHELANKLEAEASHRLFSAFVVVLLATATGVFIQYLAYKFLGMQVGHVGFFKNRVTFDVLVPAYSALSAVLAPGLAVAPVLWLRKNYALAVASPLICGLAILINSSRTGLLAGLLGMAIFILYPSRGVNLGRSVLLLIPASGFAIWILQKMLGASRFKGASAFASNGRFETYQDGLAFWTEDLRFILFGRGYAQYPTTPPHNFLLETLVCSGIVVLVLVMVWLVRFIASMARVDWMYPTLTLLVAGLLFSGFYNVKALTILLVCGIICSVQVKSRRLRDESSQERTRNPDIATGRHRAEALR